MKIFISQPMRGLPNEKIKREREKIIKDYGFNEETVLDTIFDLETNNPLIYLSKSIEKLAEADLIVFTNGWDKSRGCIIEYEISKKYGKHIFILGED